MADQFLECQRDLLRLQRGVITRRQALAAGLTDKAIVVRLQSGRWQRLQTGVYATFSGEPPRSAILWAAVLRAGRGAVLSHQTAAELHGLIDTPARLIHLTVPSGSQVSRSAGIMVNYSARLDQTRHPALLPPRSRVEDNVLDLVGDATSLDEVVSLISLAVGRRRTTAQLILSRRTRRSGRPPTRIAVAGHAARQHQHGQRRGHAPARLCRCFRAQLRVGHPRGPDTATPGLAGDAVPMRMLLSSSVLISSSHFCPYGGRKQNG
jgi:hypothetical protein